jgi:hypothetical protein
MAGLSQDAALPAGSLIAALLLWTLVPLSAASLVLRRRQL